MTDPIDWTLQKLADDLMTEVVKQDPAPTGSDLAYTQELIRGAYEDAAHATEQPEEEGRR